MNGVVHGPGAKYTMIYEFDAKDVCHEAVDHRRASPPAFQSNIRSDSQRLI